MWDEAKRSTVAAVMQIVQSFGHMHGACVAMSLSDGTGTGTVSNIPNLIECSVVARNIPIMIDILERVCGRGVKIEMSEPDAPAFIAACPILSVPTLSDTSIFRIRDAGGGHAVAATASRWTVWLAAVHWTSAWSKSPIIVSPSAYIMRHGVRCVFDHQILSKSRRACYLKRVSAPHAMQPSADIASQLIRAQKRRFCLVNPCYLVTAAQHAAAIQYAAQMVDHHGWCMDDHGLGRTGWVVSRWSDVLCAPERVRGVVDQSTVSIAQHLECPLCLSDFTYNDVVVNLPCNHNFHVQCSPASGSSGFVQWLLSGDNPTCPCCRANVGHAMPRPARI